MTGKESVAMLVLTQELQMSQQFVWIQGPKINTNVDFCQALSSLKMDPFPHQQLVKPGMNTAGF